MVIEKLGSSLANQGSPIKFLLRFIYLVCIFVCGCVRVCVRTSRSQDNFCSYFSPGDWTQVWKLTSSAFTHWTITGSRMSYKFKIWNFCGLPVSVSPGCSNHRLMPPYLTSTYTLRTTHRKHADSHTRVCANTYARMQVLALSRSSFLSQW